MDNKLEKIYSAISFTIKLFLCLFIGLNSITKKENNTTLYEIKIALANLSLIYITYKVLAFFIPSGIFAFGALAFVGVLVALLFPLKEIIGY